MLTDEQIKEFMADEKLFRAFLEETDKTLEGLQDQNVDLQQKLESAEKAAANAVYWMGKSEELTKTVQQHKDFVSYVYTLLPIGVVSFEEYLDGKRSGEAIEAYHREQDVSRETILRRKIEQEFKNKIGVKDNKINELQGKLEALEVEKRRK